jgi:hypothetical protein
MQTAELLVPKPSSFEVETPIEMLVAEVIQAGSNTLFS